MSDLLEEGLQKTFLRLRYNVEHICRKYERISQEEDVSLELNCTTGEWYQVVKLGEEPLTKAEVKKKLRDLDFGKDLVGSSSSIEGITDENTKIRVLKHNKRFERHYKAVKERHVLKVDNDNNYSLSQVDVSESKPIPNLPHVEFIDSENDDLEEDVEEEKQVILIGKGDFGISEDMTNEKHNSIKMEE
ncbi:hypothetical protein FO519_001938 [Halicephalobus sp. NKZ332]|nr:hypothetical protein FO519_001938 [Halicephalobus sp. NKZ332]